MWEKHICRFSQIVNTFPIGLLESQLHQHLHTCPTLLSTDCKTIRPGCSVMLTTIKVDWWHCGVGWTLHVPGWLMFIHSTSVLLIGYGVSGWSGRLKLENLSEMHVESGFCLCQNYVETQRLHPYWALSWCYNILHPSGKTFRKTLEAGCRDLLPFLQSAFQFIPKVLRSGFCAGQSCSTTPNLFMDPVLCMGESSCITQRRVLSNLLPQSGKKCFSVICQYTSMRGPWNEIGVIVKQHLCPSVAITHSVVSGCLSCIAVDYICGFTVWHYDLSV